MDGAAADHRRGRAAAGRCTYDAALPGGGDCQWYGGVVGPDAARAAVAGAAEVGGRAGARVPGKALGARGRRAGPTSDPPEPRYHDRAWVPGIGKRENDCEKAA